MFIAHLPAGYLLSTALLAFWTERGTDRQHLLKIGLVASVLPDFDLLYGLFVHLLRVHHHRYVTHWPLFWLALWGGGILLLALTRNWQTQARQTFAQRALAMLGLNALLHLALDTIASDMWLLAPFSDTAWKLITVPARYRPWVLNYGLHWTVWLEVGIVVTAAVVALGRRRQRIIERPTG